MAVLAVSVDDLQRAFDDLRQALETRDAASIVSATRAVRGAVEAINSEDLGPVGSDVRAKLEALAPEIDAARVQVNVAADRVRQRMARLAQRGVETAAPMTYGR